MDGAEVYVGRAHHAGHWLPAKVIPSKTVAYVPYAGAEIPKYQYQVHFTSGLWPSVSVLLGDSSFHRFYYSFQILCGTVFEWVASTSGLVPEGAVMAGLESNGEPLYVGRAYFRNTLTPGKVQCSHNCLYIPFDGAERSISQYEVLVERATSTFNVKNDSFRMLANNVAPF